MADKKPSNDRKVITPKFRVSFPWVFRPQPPMEGSAPGTEAKYGVTMLFGADAQKDPAFLAMKKLAIAAGKEKFGARFEVKDGQWPAGFRNPFRKGEEKAELEGYGPGVIFCNATSKMKPGLVGADARPLMSEDDFYAGCYARASIVAYGYDKAGNKGVAFGLNNVQKLGDGESFSGRVKAEDEFEAMAGADDPFASEGGGGDDFLA